MNLVWRSHVGNCAISRLKMLLRAWKEIITWVSLGRILHDNCRYMQGEIIRFLHKKSAKFFERNLWETDWEGKEREKEREGKLPFGESFVCSEKYGKLLTNIHYNKKKFLKSIKFSKFLVEWKAITFLKWCSNQKLLMWGKSQGK